MEVHHPHHVTHKKKWSEYLLEFLMLFLAVFLGFIAENEREHLAESSRAKDYAKSFLSDLKADTAELNAAESSEKFVLMSIDSITSISTNIKHDKMYRDHSIIIQDSCLTYGL